MNTRLSRRVRFSVRKSKRPSRVERALPPPRQERCVSCGSPSHLLCARMSPGDELVLVVRRPV